jgi:hypothetical protein
MLLALTTPGQRGTGVTRLLACAVLDFLLLACGLFAVAMLVSPWLGI